MKKLTKGFTLIELLVVIAIIGILAAIVFVNVNSARNQAKDATVKSELAQIRTQAEVFYSLQTPGTYYGMDGSGTANIGNMLAIATLQGTTPTKNITGSGVTPSLYCIQYVLPSGTAGSWCVDNTGYSGSTANCNATKFSCSGT